MFLLPKALAPLSFALLSLKDPNTMDPPSITDTYKRLVEKLKPRLENFKDGDEPYWVGIAGGPGSGKSTVAEDVADLLNEIEPDSTVVIPMDGWHIPQEDLVAKFGEDAMLKRGAPWTFDFDLMAEQLKEAKENNQATLPTYCREISDPIPTGVELKPNHKIVFVEGIYLLWKEKYPDLYNLWDEQWFVQCPSRDEQIERIVKRSLKTWSDKKAKIWGEGEAGARKRVESNDVKNMDMVGHCTQHAAEVVITTAKK